MKGKILDIGYLGNLSTYHVEVAGGDGDQMRGGQSLPRVSRRDFTWEDEVWLSWTRNRRAWCCRHEGRAKSVADPSEPISAGEIVWVGRPP